MMAKTHLLTLDLLNVEISMGPCVEPQVRKTLKLYITEFHHSKPNDGQFTGGLLFDIRVSSQRELFKLYRFLEENGKLLQVSKYTPNYTTAYPWLHKPFSPKDLIVLYCPTGYVHFKIN